MSVKFMKKARSLIKLISLPVLGAGVFALSYWIPAWKDVCLSVATGFIVFFATVSIPNECKRHALKKVLRKRYDFFKRSVLSILLGAEGRYDSNLLKKCMKSDCFNYYISSRACEGQSHLDAMMNGLNNNPSLISDLNVEIRLFFDSVLLLASNVNVSSTILNRIGEYAASFRRVGSNSLLKSDVEHIATGNIP